MNKMILIGAGALVLVGASVGGAMFVMKGRAEVPVPGAPPVAAALPAETHYYRMQPEFVVNLPQPSRDRFLMVELAVATEHERHLDLLERHMPELRNELLTVFGERDGESLATAEGKRTLRDDARDRVDAMLARHDGEPAPVKDVFLTRFVMQ